MTKLCEVKCNFMQIRKMELDDLDAVMALCFELSPLPFELAQLVKRFELINTKQSHRLFVAENEKGQVVGWVHAHESASLMHDLRTEVAGIVVDAQSRGSGIGKALMRAVESWSLSCGYRGTTLSSNIKREASHHFYRNLGYEFRKTRFVFDKSL